MPGARIVLECLKRQGVDLIFGLPGGAVLPIYDALYDFQGLRHILVRQEAAAGHAAEGYARTSGPIRSICGRTTRTTMAIRDRSSGRPSSWRAPTSPSSTSGAG